MLLIIVKRHCQGTPDFEYVAAQIGVTKDAARIKFNNMRREMSIPDGNGLATPPSSPPRKRKAKERPVVDSAKEEGEAEEEERTEGKAKRAKSHRNAAVEASAKVKEKFEEDPTAEWECDEEI